VAPTAEVEVDGGTDGREDVSSSSMRVLEISKKRERE